jgi:hypothetical protein
MKIHLDFDERDISNMYGSQCASFIMQQPDRFTVYDNNSLASMHPYIRKHSDVSSLLFCDSFLEAKIVMSVYIEKKYNPILLSDELSGSWVIWIDLPYEAKL